MVCVCLGQVLCCQFLRGAHPPTLTTSQESSFISEQYFCPAHLLPTICSVTGSTCKPIKCFYSFQRNEIFAFHLGLADSTYTMEFPRRATLSRFQPSLGCPVMGWCSAWTTFPRWSPIFLYSWFRWEDYFLMAELFPISSLFF